MWIRRQNIPIVTQVRKVYRWWDREQTLQTIRVTGTEMNVMTLKRHCAWNMNTCRASHYSASTQDMLILYVSSNRVQLNRAARVQPGSQSIKHQSEGRRCQLNAIIEGCETDSMDRSHYIHRRFKLTLKSDGYCRAPCRMGTSTLVPIVKASAQATHRRKEDSETEQSSYDI